MGLKKVILAFVILILVSLLIINTHFTIENRLRLGGTGAVTATTLPPPPTMPGFEQPSSTTDSTDEIEAELQSLRSQLASITDLSQRMSTAESDINDMRQKMTKLQQQIANTEAQLQSISESAQGTVKQESSGSVFGVIMDIILTLAIAGIIGYYMYMKNKQEEETTQAIIDYLNQNRQKGYTDQQLQSLLRQSGYTTDEINKALNKMNQPSLQKR